MPKSRGPGSSPLGWVLSLLGLVTSALLLLGYFHFEINQQDPIWSNIVAGLIGAILAPTAWYLLFGKHGVSLPSMQSEIGAGTIVTFYPTHEEVDWGSIIRSARTLDVVVHYYGRWARKHEQDFIAFFQKGGKLRLVMADPDIKETLAAVHEHFFDNLTRDQLREKIFATEEVYRDLFQEAGSHRASLSVLYFPKVLHYSFVLVDDRMLYLSVYEQFRGRNVRSSVFGIDLGKDQSLEAYWIENRDEFLARSRHALSS